MQFLLKKMCLYIASPFLCSGVENDSSSLMQQKLEKQVGNKTFSTTEQHRFSKILLLMFYFSKFVAFLLFCNCTFKEHLLKLMSSNESNAEVQLTHRF